MEVYAVHYVHKWSVKEGNSGVATLLMPLKIFKTEKVAFSHGRLQKLLIS